MLLFMCQLFASVLVKALFSLTYISRLLPKQSISELCSQCVFGMLLPLFLACSYIYILFY